MEILEIAQVVGELRQILLAMYE
jgi:hypothetical protein